MVTCFATPWVCFRRLVSETMVVHMQKVSDSQYQSDNMVTYFQGPIRKVELSCLPGMPQHGLRDLCSTNMLGWWLSKCRVGVPWMPLHLLLYYKYLWKNNKFYNVEILSIHLYHFLYTTTLGNLVRNELYHQALGFNRQPQPYFTGVLNLFLHTAKTRRWKGEKDWEQG